MAGHYSPCIKSGDFIYTSGQLPIIDGRKPEDIKAQTKLVLDKVEALLKAHGLDRTAIIKTTVFITKMEHWGDVNEVYIEYFTDHKPARTIVPVPELHHGCLIELEAIAHIPE